MEAWREELYLQHGLFDRLRNAFSSSRTSSSISSRSVSNNSNREWKTHKYIKKVNGRYYYPDDLKAKVENNSASNSNNSESSGVQSVNNYLYKISYKYRLLSDSIKTVGSAINKLYNKGKQFIESMKTNKTKDESKVNTRSMSAYDVSKDGEGYSIYQNVPDEYQDIFKAFSDILEEQIKNR